MTWRWSNVPVPEPCLAALTAGWLLGHRWPWRVRMPRGTARLAGTILVGSGAALAASAVRAMGDVDAAHPERRTTTGPYAVVPHPMYLGCLVVQVGIGVAARSGWQLALVVPTGAALRRVARREEADLARRFGVGTT
jgi:protein-S-isoprenylcysteine O-methyltransferase Ste14